MDRIIDLLDEAWGLAQQELATVWDSVTERTPELIALEDVAEAIGHALSAAQRVPN